MIRNITRTTILATNVKIARNPGDRMKGLLGLKFFPQGEALIITQCQSIHMFFMNFPIDVVFCDTHHKVVGLCADIKPFFLSPIFFKASFAIELPSGSIAASKTEVGDEIDLPLTH